MSVSSDLRTQPSWLDTFPDEDVAFGFDSENGMWFSGNASNAPYPIRTNYDIDSDTTVVVVYTFVHAAVDVEDGSACPDHGICFFKADAEPYWSWGSDVSRIAVQYNCGNPEMGGQSGNESESTYSLTVGNTYTARVTYNPAAETITHELFAGTSPSGEPVDTFLLTNERLPAGAYRIGFHADLDTGTSERAYFTYLQISAGPADLITRVFRSVHMPRRRRAAENPVDGAPIDVQPGELLYDFEQNKLYAGQDDQSVVEISGGVSNGITLTNGTQITVGSFDNMTGGQNGIGLHCYVGYELNWQGGRLRSVYIGDTDGTPQTLYMDSPLEFAGPGAANMTISALGLTFPNATTQSSAGVVSDITGITGAVAVTNIVKISQAAYNAIATKDPATVYIIDG